MQNLRGNNNDAAKNLHTLPGWLGDNYDGTNPYDGGKQGVFREKTTTVESFKPNAWGLYDMHGNVTQWCQDLFGHDYYAHSPKTDPQGPIKSDVDLDHEFRVLRSGSWADYPTDCRSARRCCASPTNCDLDSGFRVVVEIK